MTPTEWTAAALTDALQGLSAEFESEAKRTDDAVHPYLAAAAVLATFEPETIMPAGHSNLDRIEAVAKLLQLSTPVPCEDGVTRWMLNTDVRRDALMRLGTREAMVRALAENQRVDDALQRTFEAVISGTNRSVDGQSRDELARILQVSRWLEDILPGVPEPARVRRALDREALLEPFRRLVGEHFAGRHEELRRLRSYVDVLQTSSVVEAFTRAVRADPERQPLVIDGVGGVGKSTLVAKFVLDHIGPDGVSEMPFSYIDYDSPQVSAFEPASVLVEAARQLGNQRDAEAWEEVRADLTRRVAEANKTRTGRRSGARGRRPTLLRPSQRSELVAAFALALQKSSHADLPWLLVLDTFEEVQYLGEDVVREIGRFLAELDQLVPQLRTIIAGRAPIAEFENVRLALGSLDDEAAAGFLRAHGVPSLPMAEELVSRLGGNPLTLQLAARAIETDVEEMETIRGLRAKRRWFLA